MRTALDIALTVAPLLPGWLLTTLTVLALWTALSLALAAPLIICRIVIPALTHAHEGD